MRAPARGLSVLLATALALFTTMTPGFAVLNGDTEITVGSNDAIFSQNKQNGPAIAVDASHTNVLAVGDNDNIDLEACNVGDDRTCPFTPGVGVTGIQFSFDSGSSWIQPTYTGFSARGCLGTPGVATDTCTPDPNGPIGTLPWSFEECLVSNVHPALALWPQPAATRMETPLRRSPCWSRATAGTPGIPTSWLQQAPTRTATTLAALVSQDAPSEPTRQAQFMCLESASRRPSPCRQ